MMKKILLSALISVISILMCYGQAEKPVYLKDLYTGIIFHGTEYESYMNKLKSEYTQKYVNKGDSLFDFYFSKMFYHEITNDSSIIQPFNYDVRINFEYVKRRINYDKIGTEIPKEKLLTINNDSIQIGGKQDKPMLINLWFVSCTGCVQEIPELNMLKEKYGDKMNFVAMTFDNKARVRFFLLKKQFKYAHIADATNFIDKIKTSPYPESLFVDKNGKIRYIEGLLMGENTIKYIEHIIEKLIAEP
jgi:thiol-disulfide isomerase/thioredoxin